MFYTRLNKVIVLCLQVIVRSNNDADGRRANNWGYSSPLQHQWPSLYLPTCANTPEQSRYLLLLFINSIYQLSISYNHILSISRTLVEPYTYWGHECIIHIRRHIVMNIEQCWRNKSRYRYLFNKAVFVLYLAL